MRGYLPAWSARLLPAVVSARSHALRQLPVPRPAPDGAERLEVLERLAHERRRALRGGEYVPARRLY